MIRFKSFCSLVFLSLSALFFASCHEKEVAITIQVDLAGYSDAQIKMISSVELATFAGKYDEASANGYTYFSGTGKKSYFDLSSVSNTKKLETTSTFSGQYQEGQDAGVDFYDFTVTLLDKGGEKIAIQTKRVDVQTADYEDVDATVVFVFKSGLVSSAACNSFGDANKIVSSDNGTSMGTFVWNISQSASLMVYTDMSNNIGALMSVKINEAGQPISTPQLIFSSDKISSQPSLIKANVGYYLAWQEGQRKNSFETLTEVIVHLVHLNEDGVPDSAIKTISTTSIEARPVVVEAYGFLALAWFDDLGNVINGTVKVPKRVVNLAYLSTTDFSEVLPIMQMDGMFPDLAVTSSGKLIMSWIGQSYKEVYSASVNQALILSNQKTIYSSDVIAQQLRMTGTDSGAFVAWEDLAEESNAFGPEQIRGAYVNDMGTLGANGTIEELHTGSANWPSPTWNGTEVAVAYYQFREFGSQIFMTRYGQDGTRLENIDLQLTNIAGHARFPKLRHLYSDMSGNHYGVSWTDDSSGKNEVYYRTILCK